MALSLHFIGGMLLMAASAITMTVFMGLWVYHDAKERGIEHPALWTLLAVLLSNFIGLIIYVVIRSTQGKKRPCPSCGFMLPESDGFCARCGERQPPLNEYPQTVSKAKRYFKGLLISAGVFVLTIIIIVVSQAAMIAGSIASGSFPARWQYSGYIIAPSYNAAGLKMESDGSVCEMSFKSLDGDYNLTNLTVTEDSPKMLDIEYAVERGSLRMELRGDGRVITLGSGGNAVEVSKGEYEIHVYGDDARDGYATVRISGAQ